MTCVPSLIAAHTCGPAATPARTGPNSQPRNDHRPSTPPIQRSPAVPPESFVRPAQEAATNKPADARNCAAEIEEIRYRSFNNAIGTSAIMDKIGAEGYPPGHHLRVTQAAVAEIARQKNGREHGPGGFGVMIEQTLFEAQTRFIMTHYLNNNPNLVVNLIESSQPQLQFLRGIPISRSCRAP